MWSYASSGACYFAPNICLSKPNGLWGSTRFVRCPRVNVDADIPPDPGVLSGRTELTSRCQSARPGGEAFTEGIRPAARAGAACPHKFLLGELWDDLTDAQYLRVYVRQLRQKIEADHEQPQYILTETGIGYRLRAPD